MNIRKLASVGLMIATVVVTLTGIFLYIGKGDHHLMVLAHDVFSITFILFMVIHMNLNWKPFKNYFAARKELIVNITIAVLFVAAIAKINSAKPQLTYSEYPPVEKMPLEVVLATDGVDYDEALGILQEKGFVIPEGALTIEALTKANKMNPKVIYGTMAVNKMVE